MQKLRSAKATGANTGGNDDTNSNSSSCSSLSPSSELGPMAGGSGMKATDNGHSTPNPKGSPHPLRCPRCDSMDTKFCYYNNYSLTQPRYFCKNCKRYWTAGGALRNVPVGGGLRKNKRAKLLNPPNLNPSPAPDPDLSRTSSSSSSSSSSSTSTSSASGLGPMPNLPAPARYTAMMPPASYAHQLQQHQHLSLMNLPDKLAGSGGPTLDLLQQAVASAASPSGGASNNASTIGLGYPNPHTNNHHTHNPNALLSGLIRGVPAAPPSNTSLDSNYHMMSNNNNNNNNNSVSISSITAGFPAESRSHLPPGHGRHLLPPLFPTEPSSAAALQGSSYFSMFLQPPPIHGADILAEPPLNGGGLAERMGAAAAVGGGASKPDEADIGQHQHEHEANGSGTSMQLQLPNANSATQYHSYNPISAAYDWQQLITDGLFNANSGGGGGGGDGFLYPLPPGSGGGSGWPDFSDHFNDTTAPG